MSEQQAEWGPQPAAMLSALDELDTELNQLSDSVDGVRARLIPILELEAPALAAPSDRDERPMTALRSRTLRLRELSAQLREITRRVDL